MLIECDMKALEWRTVIQLSGDKVGLGEILSGLDFHSDNQRRYKFPAGKEGRDLAKTFIFRAIYKGPAYAYANDPRFMGVSSSEKFWQDIIDKTYEKYSGLAEWHRQIIQEVNNTGRLTNPTGRVYTFERDWRGQYPERDIVNHPVQGLAAEFMAIARMVAYQRYKKYHLKDRLLFVNTVHDSIVVDANVREGSDELRNICIWLEDIFSSVPRNFEKIFGSKIVTPLCGECKYGMDWYNMKEFIR